MSFDRNKPPFTLSDAPQASSWRGAMCADPTCKLLHIVLLDKDEVPFARFTLDSEDITLIRRMHKDLVSTKATRDWSFR